jgi:4-nitrophenyl phosphatase
MAKLGVDEEAAICGVISDLDGVAYRGDEPIADSVAAFRAWQARGVPYAFVTNNSTMTSAQFAAKLGRMGVPATAAQVFSTIGATASFLAQHWPAGARVFAIGERPLLDALTERGFQAAEDAEVVVLGFDSQLSYAKLRTAVRAALGGATIVVTNPDVLTPTHDGFDPCVGAVAAAVMAAAPAARQIVVGKPQPLMIEQALAHIGTAKSQTIMIGDQVDTDIVAGQRAGLHSVLLGSAMPSNGLSRAKPDRTVSSLLELVDARSRKASA